ncbi:conserved hypothetical protein [Xenorhabdus nematophila F1]|uniref:Uncharacterized protein n=1 Tax=Xenorhabdus nematophila (strain ATCC 19061 / DSM 3370 / CCUG 14189 / LMG 1036 / NCIMB 9965 / AN6) TaxID=406817 RepID=D3VIW4_XENNA|nr:hypothetical protein XNC1_2767 [Xenorhabdus nematophila ATCC 19061]CCW29317.1 conserved hypothetical protein [Xenorhabdus nematophila F1]CEE90249.1 hypothetical protein XNA1_1280006 [Xenorhabdus nematophila str. Anatoliense]CEF32151.1 hypothetical protein XNW1_4250006 [Xenorhabdus nematophila str. Websteri]CEK23658.1 hypothetical protein XNC2_2664 [Xenorhabdus nematophila AN6/1]
MSVVVGVGIIIVNNKGEILFHKLNPVCLSRQVHLNDLPLPLYEICHKSR